MSIIWAEHCSDELEEKTLTAEEIVSLYRKAYSILNIKLFYGELPEIKIDYFENGYEEMFKECRSIGSACFVTGTEPPFIIMGFDTYPGFGLFEEDIRFLFHEMVHYYCYLHEIEDTDEGFHNLNFKKAVEEHGGSCHYVDDEIGYSDTILPVEVVSDILYEI